MSAASAPPGNFALATPFSTVPRAPRLTLPDSPPRLDDASEASIRGHLSGAAVSQEIALIGAAIRSGPRTYSQPGPIMRTLIARLRPLLEIQSELAGQDPKVDGQVGALLLQTALDTFGLDGTLGQARWSVGFLLNPATIDDGPPLEVGDDPLYDLLPVQRPSEVMRRDRLRRRYAEHAERCRLATALQAAIAALTPALADAVGRAVDAAGGPRRVSQALGDARALGGLVGPGPNEDDARLAELDRQLGELDSEGDAHAALTAEAEGCRRRQSGRIDRWKADRRAEDIALVDGAVAGDVPAYEKLRADVRRQPSAFTPDLTDALDRAATEAMASAGVANFAGLQF